MRFRSYLDGGERFLGPETSMAVQAALGSDIALVFDECTPFHVTREYTARSTERTHRWLERCLSWHAEHGPSDQVVYGIVQGGVEHDLRLESAATVAASACDGVAIGGSLGRDKAQMHEVVSWATAELERRAPGRPRHLLGIGDIDDLIAGVARASTRSTARCPLAWPATAWRSCPIRRTVAPRPGQESGGERASEPILDGCPCPTCSRGYTRAYLHYLLRAGELTALRCDASQPELHRPADGGSAGRRSTRGRLAEVAAALRRAAPVTSCPVSLRV